MTPWIWRSSDFRYDGSGTFWRHGAFFKVQRGKIVRHCLRAPDPFDGAVLSQQKLLRPQLGVIVKPHGMPVCPGILNNQGISGLDFRKPALNSEFVNILTQGSDDI